MRVLLAFLLIIFISFAVTASSLTDYVSHYLYEQRIRQDSLSVERLATTVAPLFAYADEAALNQTMTEAGGEMGGRLLILDQDGKVQFDSFAGLMGTRLQLPEVLSVLQRGEGSAYGIHRQAEMGEGVYVVMCASRIRNQAGDLGVLLYISPFDEMIESLGQVIRRVWAVFLIAGTAAVAAAMIFARLLTRPIAGLTQTIEQMGAGDLSVRAKVEGARELRHLAESYNAMAAELETLDRSRNQFVSDASHELKTPLTTMKILLQNIILDQSMPREVERDFLSDMDGELDRLSDIVNDLLTLTKMDAHHVVMNNEWMSFSDTCEESIRLLRTAAEQRQQTLISRVNPGVMLMGDRTKLGQVVYNLVENAIKYTQPGGRIVVTLVQKGRQAILTVQDNGMGIPQDSIGHVFDRFYRVDRARARDTGGTGLGLSIVRQLVQLHGGKVDVQSVEGEGSAFKVTLPIDGKEGRLT